jgi:hypothetical protein
MVCRLSLSHFCPQFKHSRFVSNPQCRSSPIVSQQQQHSSSRQASASDTLSIRDGGKFCTLAFFLLEGAAAPFAVSTLAPGIFNTVAVTTNSCTGRRFAIVSFTLFDHFYCLLLSLPACRKANEAIA